MRVTEFDIARFSLCNWPARHRNEDRLFLRQSGKVLLACVFDGITTSDGCLAAKTGARAFKRMARRLLPTLRRGKTDPQALLRTCIDAANQALIRLMPRHDVGSTVSAVLTREGKIFSAWLGDSPILLYAAEADELRPLFFPHRNPRGEITRFLGLPGLRQEDIPVLCEDLSDDSMILLGSDGALETLAYPDDLWSETDQAGFLRHYGRYIPLLYSNRSANDFAEALQSELQKRVVCDDASLIAICPASAGEGR